MFNVPLDDVDQRLLRRSEHHTWCPYKGEASYYDIVEGEGTDLDAAVWYYDDPFPAVAEIKGHVAFTPTGSPSSPPLENPPYDKQTCLEGRCSR